MPRLDHLIFGYRRISFARDSVPRAASALLKRGIAASFSPDGSIAVAERCLKKVRAALASIEYSVSEPLGLFAFLRRGNSRIAIVALLVTALLVPLSGSVVWDVRIEGAVLASEEQIIRELAVAGLRVGSRWSSIDTDKIEAQMLDASESVSWLSINRRGTVAYVSVIDKESHLTPSNKSGFANVVAARDCVIEEISVKRGYPLVKAGETVREGQILISGVIPAEFGGGFCYADGSVIGSFSGSVSVSVAENEEKRVAKNKRFCGMSVKFFGFSAKVLKIYRKTRGDCVIIEDNRQWRLFGKRLPVQVIREYSVEYAFEKSDYSYADMAEIAMRRLHEALADALGEATLQKIKTQGAFSDGAYTLRSDYVCTASVGTAQEFDVAE